MSGMPRMSISAGGVETGGRVIRNTYPTLDMEQTLQCLGELGITNLRDKDLQDPKPETAVKMYEFFIEYALQKSKDELSQPHFAALDAVKWPVRWEFPS